MRYPKGNERTLTRQHGRPARFSYELQTVAGSTLQGNDNLETLLKYLAEKRDVVVVRTKDAQVVARSPETTQ